MESNEKRPYSWFDELCRQNPAAEAFRAEYEAERANTEKRLAELNEALTYYNQKFADAVDSRVYNLVAKRRYLIEYQNNLYDKASGYTTLIVSAGYAGLFTAWSNCSNALTFAQNRMIGGLAIFSLMVFVGWEIAKMVHAAELSKRDVQLLESDDGIFDPEMEKWRKWTDASTLWFQKAWIYQFVLCTVPGLLAGAILIVSAIERSLR